MKNTRANKERFFALYWGQKVGSILKTTCFVCAHKISALSMLRLTPLLSITDEDATELSKFIFESTKNIDSSALVHHGKLFCSRLMERERYLTYGAQGYMVDSAIHCFQYLQGNGYALPWTTPEGETITVEEQIEFGWVELKTE